LASGNLSQRAEELASGSLWFLVEPMEYSDVPRLVSSSKPAYLLHNAGRAEPDLLDADREGGEHGDQLRRAPSPPGRPPRCVTA